MNKCIKSLSLAALMSVIFTSPLFAEISSSVCPYSCRTQGIPKNVCKDWKENGRCFIDDLRVRPGVLSNAEQARRDQIERDRKREEERRRIEEENRRKHSHDHRYDDRRYDDRRYDDRYRDRYDDRYYHHRDDDYYRRRDYRDRYYDDRW